MNSGPSCEAQFQLAQIIQYFKCSFIPGYEVTRTWGCVATEFEDMAMTASPFCRKRIEYSYNGFYLCKSNLLLKKEKYFFQGNWFDYLHIELCKLYNVFFQVLNEWTVVTYKHNLQDHKKEEKQAFSKPSKGKYHIVTKLASRERFLFRISNSKRLMFYSS